MLFSDARFFPAKKLALCKLWIRKEYFPTSSPLFHLILLNGLKKRLVSNPQLTEPAKALFAQALKPSVHKKP